MKKLRVLSILFSIMFIGTSFIACAGGADDELDEEVPATTATEEAADTSSTRQQQIDNAAAGSTVTLNTAFTDTSITITKPLTVNGNGISGLTVTVNSNVTSNVTLKNFVNANIIVKPVSSTNNNIRNISGIRSARSAIVTQPYYSTNSSAGSSNEGFEKMGDNALPLKLEDCEIAKFDAEADVALYMESGDGKKSVIDEINLKSGVEEFTFIEMDKADKPETDANEATATDKKSNVGELNIEGNGIEKINLIGGTFDDVNIADGFTGDPIDFKYDKEFADQFGNFSGKDAFFGDEKIAEKDVGIAEKTGSGNVYAFSISQENFNSFCTPDQFGNGSFAIVFMTDAQKTAITAASNPSNPYHDLNPWPGVATFANPIYAAIPAGFFAVDENATGNTRTIYGTEYAYVDYAAAYARGDANYKFQDVIVLDKYRNYNKEAFVAKVENGDVTIFVDMEKIKKEDVLLCAFWEPAEDEIGTVPKGAEAGTKMTEMNLDDYKPYLVINSFNQGEEFDNAFNSVALHQGTNQQSMRNMIPFGNAIKLQGEYSVIYIPMTAGATYPSVTGVQYTVKDTPYTPGTLHPLQDQDFD